MTAMFLRYGMETRLKKFAVLYVYTVIQKCISDLRKKNNKVERTKKIYAKIYVNWKVGEVLEHKKIYW